MISTITIEVRIELADPRWIRPYSRPTERSDGRRSCQNCTHYRIAGDPILARCCALYPAHAIPVTEWDLGHEEEWTTVADRCRSYERDDSVSEHPDPSVVVIENPED